MIDPNPCERSYRCRTCNATVRVRFPEPPRTEAWEVAGAILTNRVRCKRSDCDPVQYTPETAPQASPRNAPRLTDIPAAPFSQPSRIPMAGGGADSGATEPVNGSLFD